MPATNSPSQASTPTSPEVEGTPPGFKSQARRTPTPDPTLKTMPAETPKMTSTAVPPNPWETTDSPEDGSDAGDEFLRLSEKSGTDTPSRISTADAEAIGELVTVAAKIPTLILNKRRADGTDIWLLDESDEEAICAPLARILARHAPAVDGETSDVVDGLLVVVGTGGYVLKNVEAERKIIAAQRAGAWSEAENGEVPR